MQKEVKATMQAHLLLSSSHLTPCTIKFQACPASAKVTQTSTRVNTVSTSRRCTNNLRRTSKLWREKSSWHSWRPRRIWVNLWALASNRRLRNRMAVRRLGLAGADRHKIKLKAKSAITHKILQRNQTKIMRFSSSWNIQRSESSQRWEWRSNQV